jgi:hypothetical protein
MGGAVDTTALINYEQNSVVAEFCRRAQAVTWNRALVKTESGKLGWLERTSSSTIWYAFCTGVVFQSF